MELIITDTAKEDIRFFIKSGKVNIVKKIQPVVGVITAPLEYAYGWYGDNTDHKLKVNKLENQP